MVNKISIVVSTYNQPEFLSLVLSSLANQVGISYANCEVIIADDGSTYDTKKVVTHFQESYPCKLVHMWHDDAGFRKAMILNKAVAMASGSYLIFIDGDCTVGKDFIYKHIKLAEQKYFVAGNRVLLSESFTKEIVKNRLNLQNKSFVEWMIMALSKKSNKFLHWLRLSTNGAWRKSRQNDWRYPKGCNIAMWKSDYIAVNGYDENFTGWGHEDADFFIRLLHSGVRIKDGRFAVPVYHLWHKLSSRNNEKENLARMMERSRDKSCIKAKVGISQYLF